jgi:PPM family protein phosphatase
MEFFKGLFKSDSKSVPSEKQPDKPSIKPMEGAMSPDTPTLSTDPQAPTSPIAPPTISTSAPTAPLAPDTLPVNQPPSMLDPRILEGVTRQLQLPNDAKPTSKNRHMTFGQLSDVGMARTNNQDAVFSFLAISRSADERPDVGVFVVADGMGGHHDGEKASAISARIVGEELIKHVYLPILTNVELSDRQPLSEAMSDAVLRANSSVIDQVPDGGTTLTSVTVVGDIAYIGHVGDSRAYLISSEGIEQITRDHSLVQRLVELDQITAEEALEHSQRNVLYRALGQNETLEVDTLMRRLPAGASLVLCSDGLWGYVKDHEFLEVVRAHANLQDACDKLVSMANSRGGLDNITVLIVGTAG